MGCLYAAYFARAGSEVWIADSWQEHIARITAAGVEVNGPGGRLHERIHATLDAATIPISDHVIIATKSNQAEGAAHHALRIAGDDGVILTIQNGIGAASTVAGITGPVRLLHGVVGGFAARIVAPGRIEHVGWDRLRVGEFAGGMSDRLTRAAELWRAAGFNVDCEADLAEIIWEKMVCTTAFNAICTLTGLTAGEVIRQEAAWSVASECARETCAIAQHFGRLLSMRDPAGYAKDHAQKIATARTSMAADHAAGRRSEIDELNGAVARLAAKAGRKTPVNLTVTQLIKAREACFPTAAA